MPDRKEPLIRSVHRDAQAAAERVSFTLGEGGNEIGVGHYLGVLSDDGLTVNVEVYEEDTWFLRFPVHILDNPHGAQIAKAIGDALHAGRAEGREWGAIQKASEIRRALGI